MQKTFILLRAAGYAAAAIGPFLQARPIWQWVFTLLIVLAGTTDRWKKPDDPPEVLLRGIWAEYLLIVSWSIVLHDSSVLFILVSPASRSCVHLGWRTSAVFAAIAAGTLFLFHALYPTANWILPAQVGFLLLQGGYSFVLGQLLQQRDQLRRIIAMTAFEREQHSRNEERIRIASQLHDSMGQYWTAVIRALDVALAVDGQQRHDFVSKARSAALDGLQEMRTAVHDWNEGNQSPAAWMVYLEQALARLEQLTGVAIHKDPFNIDWARLTDPVSAAEAIVRVVIESLTNAIRHGEASGIWIHSQSNERAVQLLIRDNGKGFSGSIPTGSPSGLGLASMQRLVEELDGTWRLESAPGRGTTLFLSIPYRNQQQIGMAKEETG